MAGQKQPQRLYSVVEIGSLVDGAQRITKRAGHLGVMAFYRHEVLPPQFHDNFH